MILPPLDAIDRLRVCHEAGVPPEPEIIRAVLAHFEAEDRAAKCRNERDACIRTAAALIDGSVSARALQLGKETAFLAIVWEQARLQAPERGTVRGELHRARLFAPLPSSYRQYLRILQAGDY